METERKQSKFFLFIFLIVDAFLYGWLLYGFVKLRLLAAEDIVRTSAWMFLPVAGVAVLGWLYRKELKKWFVPVTLADVLIFLLAGQAAVGVAKMKVAKAQSFLWLPLEWTKLLDHAALMWKAFPLSTFLFWAAVVFVILLVALRRRYVATAIVAAAAALAVFRIMGMEAGDRMAIYLFFIAPLIFASAAAIVNCPRAFARLILMDGVLLVTFFFYLGVIPFFPGGLSLPPGTERLYPPPGERAEFPMQFMRGLQLDGGRGALFAAYGPTSGVVRLDLKSREAGVLRHSGLIRSLWTSGSSGALYALDWLNADMLVVDKEQFAFSRRVNLFDRVLVAPVDFVVAGEKLFVLSSDRPSLTSFELESMEKEKQIDFRRKGITAFRSGAWRIVRDERTGGLFVMLGGTDPGGRFLLLRIDPEDLRIERYASLPEGGMELLALPEKRSVIAASFFSRNFYEVDMDTMEVRRVFPGVLTCRSMTYDEKRDVLIASSFTTGELAFIRYEDAEKLGGCHIGKKPSSLALSPGEDALYFGSASGIFRADLKKALSKQH